MQLAARAAAWGAAGVQHDMALREQTLQAMGPPAPKLRQAQSYSSRRHTSPRVRSSGASCCTCWHWHCSFRSTGSTTSSRARSAPRMFAVLLSVPISHSRRLGTRGCVLRTPRLCFPAVGRSITVVRSNYRTTSMCCAQVALLRPIHYQATASQPGQVREMPHLTACNGRTPRFLAG